MPVRHLWIDDHRETYRGKRITGSLCGHSLGKTQFSPTDPETPLCRLCEKYSSLLKPGSEKLAADEPVFLMTEEFRKFRAKDQNPSSNQLQHYYEAGFQRACELAQLYQCGCANFDQLPWEVRKK